MNEAGHAHWEGGRQFYIHQQQRATSRLSYNAGYVRQLVGKRVCRGKYRPNLRKAGHLGCLVLGPWTAARTNTVV